MTLNDWLACADISELQLELEPFPERKLHLLTAAFLRRVWDHLPSDHSRRAVEATEQFAEGLISADALAWARSQAARESGEDVWLAQGSFDDYELLQGRYCCPCCDVPSDHECRVAKGGGILDGAERGLETPAWVVACAAFYAAELEEPTAARSGEGPLWEWLWESLFATAREVLGEAEPPDPRWLRWRTADVLALARVIYRDQNFGLLPILADALQEAGCDDEDVLWHCRRPGGHVRGCWVLDLALGKE